MLIVRREKNPLYFILNFFLKRYRPMIGLKELALINEAIRHLRLKRKIKEIYKGKFICTP
jgi:hypothetical protein